ETAPVRPADHRATRDRHPERLEVVVSHGHIDDRPRRGGGPRRRHGGRVIERGPTGGGGGQRYRRGRRGGRGVGIGDWVGVGGRVGVGDRVSVGRVVVGGRIVVGGRVVVGWIDRIVRIGGVVEPRPRVPGHQTQQPQGEKAQDNAHPYRTHGCSSLFRTSRPLSRRPGLYHAAEVGRRLHTCRVVHFPRARGRTTPAFARAKKVVLGRRERGSTIPLS